MILGITPELAIHTLGPPIGLVALALGTSSTLSLPRIYQQFLSLVAFWESATAHRRPYNATNHTSPSATPQRRQDIRAPHTLHSKSMVALSVFNERGSRELVFCAKLLDFDGIQGRYKTFPGLMAIIFHLQARRISQGSRLEVSAPLLSWADGVSRISKNQMTRRC